MINLVIDTGLCAPESYETLRRQQSQLVSGKRAVQMFPMCTIELELPIGFERYMNERGIFHFNPRLINKDLIQKLSLGGQENRFLNLGQFDKGEIALRALAGETVLCITEYAADGVELRCAVGTDKTLEDQLRYFESTKEVGSEIVVGLPPERVKFWSE